MKCSRCTDYARTLLCLMALLSLGDSRKRRTKRGNGKCSVDSLVEYNLSFFGDWSKDAFPRMYPKYRPHAQWSKLYGLTHGRTYKLWSEGELASPAVKKFVEERSTLILEKEAQGYNDTYDIFTAAPIRGGLGRTSVRIFADGKHSKMSFLVKLIPSPDWFVGVDGLDLCRNGRWRRKVYAHLRPLDAGTDKGLTYTSPNWPAHPPQRIFQITPSYPDHPASSFFYPDRTKLPRIAHAIVERVVEYQQRGRTTDVRYNTMPNVEVIRQEHELMAGKSSSMSRSEDEEDIPLNTKLDDAVVQKLESDIQRNLKTAPRQTFFLQRMLKHRGQPLSDQSSEESDDSTEVKSASAFLAQKVSIRQTTMFVPPLPTSRTTPMPVIDPSNRNIDGYTDHNKMKSREVENDSMEDAETRLVRRPSHQVQQNIDNSREDISVEQPTEVEESLQVDTEDDRREDTDSDRHQPTKPTYEYRPAEPVIDTQQENPNVHTAPRHGGDRYADTVETTTHPARDVRQHVLNADTKNDQSRDYGAAYSISSAKTVEDRREEQDSDLQSQYNQKQSHHHDNHDVTSSYQEQPRHHHHNRKSHSRHDNEDSSRHHREDQEQPRHHHHQEHTGHHRHQEQLRRNQDNQEQPGHHYDNQEQPRQQYGQDRTGSDTRNQHHDNQDTPRHHYENHNTYETGSHRSSNRYTDGTYPQTDGNRDGIATVKTPDSYVGRDNVDNVPNQREVLESLGIFDNPKTVQKKADSDEQLDCLVGDWTQWSSCSKTCGFGVRTRSREVLQHSQNGGMNCPRLSMEVLCGSMRTCNWNYFNSMFGKYTDSRKRRRRRRKRRHHRS